MCEMEPNQQAKLGFSLESIRDYLLNEGGKVEYHKLIKHFRHALADPNNQEARVLFKDLVNKVAVVSNETNGKYLNIRPNFVSNASRPSSIASSSASSMISINQEHPLVTSITVNSSEKLPNYNRTQSVIDSGNNSVYPNQQQPIYNQQQMHPQTPSPYQHQQQHRMAIPQQSSSNVYGVAYNGSHYSHRDSPSILPHQSQIHQGHHLSSSSLTSGAMSQPFLFHSLYNKENMNPYLNGHSPQTMQGQFNLSNGRNNLSRPDTFVHSANIHLNHRVPPHPLPPKRVAEHIQTQYVPYSTSFQNQPSDSMNNLVCGNPNVVALPNLSAYDFKQKASPLTGSNPVTRATTVDSALPSTIRSSSASISSDLINPSSASNRHPLPSSDSSQSYFAEHLLRHSPTHRHAAHKDDTRPHSSNINTIWSNPEVEDRPPKPPPRRKSFASSSNTYLQKKAQDTSVKDNENFPQSMPKPFTDKLKEIHELTFNSPGRVKEHAKKLNKMVSESELRPPMPGTQAPLTPTGNNTLLVSTQPGNKEEADAMLGLSEQLKRRWMVKSSCCDYNEMLQMLRECPRLAGFKDCTSGTALHWAAKFNKPDIIKLIAGTHGISPNMRTNGGHTPLHLAAMFNNRDIVELLIKGYGADDKIRDFAGRLPLEILRQNSQLRRKEAIVIENGANAAHKHSGSLLARTASLRHTHRQLLERLPTNSKKFRTVK